MNDILREYLDLIAVGISDDVIIFSESLPEHIPHVRNILEVLRLHKLYAKVEKCEFHKDDMTFVGYLVSKVSPDDPLLPIVAALQASDEALFAIITDLEGRGGESNPALPAGNPSGRSTEQYTFQGELLYSQGRICIPPTSTPLILQIHQHYHDSPLARHYGVTKTHALVA